jgi:hypothetical protein
VLGPPKLWGWLWREWCPISASLSWVLWRALLKAEGRTAVQWREQFLAFDAPDRLLSRDVVEAFLGEIASPQQLMDILERLIEEQRLLRRDGHQLQEQLLRHVAKDDPWQTSV